MPPARQVVDPLWHCLCPSFSKSAVTRASLLRPIRQIHPRRILKAPVRLQTTTALNLGDSDFPQATVPQFQSPLAQDDDAENSNVETLYSKLKAAAARGDRDKTWELMEVLVGKKGVKPEAQHYALLIESNCSVNTGSLAEVKQLLKEMEEHRIEPDQSVYVALLKVLAIHPSYTLRSEVLDAMKSQWIDLKHESHCHLVCGLLRDRQIERALAELDEMRKTFRRPPWLMDLVIHTLADLGEFDALLPLLHARMEAKAQQPSQLLYSSVLSKAAKNLHHRTVRDIWDTQVAHSLFNPSTGLCTAVLDTAARAGDPILATDVFRILGSRSSPLTAFQYEALIESHMAATEPDLYKAFSVVCIMAQSGVSEPTDHSTRPVYTYLKQNAELMDKAWEVTLLLRRHGSKIPVVLVNGILDAAVHHGMLEWALEKYQNLHMFSDTGLANRATTFTFNTLLKGCYKERRKDLAMFIAAEMVALKVQPDALTYDRLILVCIHDEAGMSQAKTSQTRDKSRGEEGEEEEEGENIQFHESKQEQDLKNLDDAFRYLGEMQSRGWWPRKGTLNLLGLKAARCDDRRVHDLITWMEKNGTDTNVVRASLPSE